MTNFDDVTTKENIKEHNPKYSQIPNHPYRILIIGGSGSGKRNPLFNLKNKQPDIDKIDLYSKDPLEPKCQFLYNQIKITGLKHYNYSKAFIVYSNDMGDIYKNIEEYNLNKPRKTLITFDGIIADTLGNKKFNSIVPELFIRGIKLEVSLVYTMLFCSVKK